MTSNDIDEIVGSLSGLFLEYPQARRALERLEWTRRFGRNRYGSFDGMLLVGETRTGKTRLLEEFRDGWEASDRHAVRRQHQVVLIETPSPCTLKGVCMTILAHFGINVTQRPNTTTLINDTMELLKDVRTEVLVLDEAHHALRKDSRKHLSEVADFIKAILNYRVCAVVLAGMPELKEVTQANAQLRERMVYKVEMRSYRWEVREEQLEFRGILDAFEKQLPFEPIGLGRDRSLALRLWQATGGRPGSIASLLKSASIRALLNNENKLTAEHFGDAFDDARQPDPEWGLNPFERAGVPTGVPAPEEEMAIEEGEAELSGLRKGKGKEPTVSEVFRR